MRRPEPITRFSYQVVKVAQLPMPNELRDPDCMIGPWVWLRRRLRRRLPWLIPPQRPRDCCWQHRADWRAAAAAAVRLVRSAQAAGIRGDQLVDYLGDAARTEGLDARTEDAVHNLLYPGAGIELADPDATWRYQDGQHRVAAQLDQGVRLTIIQRVELLDPATGKPNAD